MNLYYLDKNPNPDNYYTVHGDGCKDLPNVDNRRYLGVFNNINQAVDEAERHYEKVNKCIFCEK